MQSTQSQSVHVIALLRSARCPSTLPSDPRLNVLFATAEGLLTLDDIERHWEEELIEDLLDVRELFDASRAQSGLDANDIQRIVSRIENTSGAAQFGKTAILAIEEPLYGQMSYLAKLSSTLRLGRDLLCFVGTTRRLVGYLTPLGVTVSIRVIALSGTV